MEIITDVTSTILAAIMFIGGVLIFIGFAIFGVAAFSDEFLGAHFIKKIRGLASRTKKS